MMKLNLSDIRYNWVVIFISSCFCLPVLMCFHRQCLLIQFITNLMTGDRDERETLPEWVFASQRKGRVVGISDPCMNPKLQGLLALQRAAYLYSLQKGYN